MIDGRLLREEDFDSVVLREAAERLNLIYRLARTYRAPELVAFLDAVAEGLLQQEDPRRSGRCARKVRDVTH
ncbi:MAG TPA: hypothetical protein VKW04_14160 [Planctomycetota bacterium]|nr:hypothetical protein [Planctomycetota bacterium]